MRTNPEKNFLAVAHLEHLRFARYHAGLSIQPSASRSATLPADFGHGPLVSGGCLRVHAACGLALLLSVGLAHGELRQFTDVDGRHLQAEIVSATDSRVEAKLKSGKTAQIELARLSEDDRIYVKEWLAGKHAGARERMGQEAAAKRAAEIPDMLTKFCKSKLGKKVGNGECWTLADEAFKACGLKRPGADMRVWGRIVDIKKEELQPGDIAEFQSARFSDGSFTASAHTAVIVKGGKRSVVVAEQNWNRKKSVHERALDLGTLVRGTVTIYRPE